MTKTLTDDDFSLLSIMSNNSIIFYFNSIICCDVEYKTCVLSMDLP